MGNTFFPPHSGRVHLPRIRYLLIGLWEHFHPDSLGFGVVEPTPACRTCLALDGGDWLIRLWRSPEATSPTSMHFVYCLQIQFQSVACDSIHILGRCTNRSIFALDDLYDSCCDNLDKQILLDVDALLATDGSLLRSVVRLLESLSSIQFITVVHLLHMSLLIF